MFRKLTIAGMLGAGLITALIAPAQAQRSFAVRSFPDQQVHYWRFTVNFNSCQLPAAAGNCSVRVGALPYNAFMLRATQQVTVAFNSTTTDTLALGTTSGSGNIVAAQSTHAAGPAAALTLANPGLGAVGAGVTGNGAAQTAQLGGGFDIWATIAYTGATAANAGQAIIVLEYAAPNDGSCAPVPANATAPAC
jgi:D-alanyl-D-alanine dipeptidase